MPDHKDRSGRHALDRLVTLTDGVVAIAITILVLQLQVPPHAEANQPFLVVLMGMARELEMYGLSFLVIACSWQSHHTVFAHLRASDGSIAWLNMLFLLSITLIPFFTQVTAEYHDHHSAIALYLASLALTGGLLLAIWLHAAPRPALVHDSLPGRWPMTRASCYRWPCSPWRFAWFR